jgi:glycerol-3-phosphate acyltransferase PlsY
MANMNTGLKALAAWWVALCIGSVVWSIFFLAKLAGVSQVVTAVAILSASMFLCADYVVDKIDFLVMRNQVAMMRVKDEIIEKSSKG